MDAASLQKNIKRQPLKGPAEAEAAGLGPWGQVRLGFRREETNLVSPGGGRRASARAAPYPAASRTRTSTLDATRIAAGRRAPQTRRSEQVRKGTRRGGLVQEGERDTVEHRRSAGRSRSRGRSREKPLPLHAQTAQEII